MDNQAKNVYEAEWICPITQELMLDPVIADDGFTYQKIVIENWFKNSNISPVTGLQLTTTKIIPNRALKNTIAQYLENKQGLVLFNQPLKKLQQKQKKQQQNKHIIHQQISLNAYSVLSNKQDNIYLLNLQIIPPTEQKIPNRKPLSMICILDTSQSMSTDAVKDTKNKQSHGFSRLDLVKHSIRTLIQFMKNQDELTLITFNTGAKCILTTTKMTVAGKKLALNKIDGLECEGTTNIWEGLRIALDILKKLQDKNKNIFTILLTDGQPNLNPPRGILPTLNKYIEIEKITNANIHVFGYGYQLDTVLLQNIARKGSGTFAYIPDCSMVGTVFINFMANCLATLTNRLQLEIEIPQSIKNIEIVGFKSIVKKNVYSLNLGVINYGQIRNILINVHNSKFQQQILNQQKIKLKLKYSSGQQVSLQINSTIQKSLSQDSEKIQFTKVRYQYLTLLKNCISYGQKFELALNQINLFYYKLLNQPEQNEFISSILKQLINKQDQNSGQVQKAFLKLQWYKKWGKIYIPSLLLAHLMQVCTNFKDPALQLYGGQLFNKYQNQLDTIFIKMIPPKPSAKKEKYIVYKPAPVDMSQYYRNYGGCIDGDCEVNVWREVYCQGNGKIEFKMVKDKLKNIKKGDIIGKNKVQIICMVETRIFSMIQMVKLQNLLITPWHPIIYNQKWVFPIEIKDTQWFFVQSYFNFITKQNKPLQIQGIQCISLGHQLQQNSVTNHEYLSSNKVIEDLKMNLPAFEEGIVQIRSVIRDQNTGNIRKFIVA